MPVYPMKSPRTGFHQVIGGLSYTIWKDEAATCRSCSALVDDPMQHSRWHASIGGLMVTATDPTAPGDGQ